MLLNSYPETAKVQDSDGFVPLHHALCYKASEEVIMILF